MDSKNKNRLLIVFFAALAGGLVISSPVSSLAQAIESQRSKPVTNGNPEPNGNASLNPKGPSTLGDPNNPLLKKSKKPVKPGQISTSITGK